MPQLLTWSTRPASESAGVTLASVLVHSVSDGTVKRGRTQNCRSSSWSILSQVSSAVAGLKLLWATTSSGAMPAGVIPEGNASLKGVPVHERAVSHGVEAVGRSKRAASTHPLAAKAAAGETFN